jgi:hypothetical protein
LNNLSRKTAEQFFDYVTGGGGYSITSALSRDASNGRDTSKGRDACNNENASNSKGHQKASGTPQQQRRNHSKDARNGTESGTKRTPVMPPKARDSSHSIEAHNIDDVCKSREDSNIKIANNSRNDSNRRDLRNSRAACNISDSRDANSSMHIDNNRIDNSYRKNRNH